MPPNPTDFIHYVLLHVIDPDSRLMVGLTKLKGPSFLLNKLTVPGGKIEAEESIFQAATRELKEEAGIYVAENDWHVFDVFAGNGYELTKLVASSRDVSNAHTVEDEPICLLNVDEHLRLAMTHPGQYSPDFVPNLHKALQYLKI